MAARAARLLERPHIELEFTSFSPSSSRMEWAMLLLGRASGFVPPDRGLTRTAWQSAWAGLVRSKILGGPQCVHKLVMHGIVLRLPRGRFETSGGLRFAGFTSNPHCCIAEARKRSKNTVKTFPTGGETKAKKSASHLTPNAMRPRREPPPA
jgi:hypothetical protein